MTLYLLDTNVCITYLRGRDTRIRDRLASHPPAAIRVCSVVVSELVYGAFRSADPGTNLTAIREFLRPYVILPFAATAAEMAGILRARLAQKGTPIGPYDVQIAATAIFENCTLVTPNVAEFSRVPSLRIEDWQA